MKAGESKVEKSLWSDYGIVNKMMCSLENGYDFRGLKKRVARGF